MKKISIGNATQFTMTKIACSKGQIPKNLKGTYYRNGPSILSHNNQYSNHWFDCCGGILKITFNNGQCSAQFKSVQTPLFKRRAKDHVFQPNYFKKMWQKYWEGSQAFNPSNTSVLLLKNSQKMYALAEGGPPFEMNKNNLESVGYDRFDWLKSAFSAHPKIDPQNGDIYNIGMNLPYMNIMKTTDNLKVICQNQLKMTYIQSIHDCCLAGNYLIFLQFPVKLNLPQFLTSTKFFFSCLTFLASQPTLIHIFHKDNLQHVKTLKTSPFYAFHFTNGYSNQEEIVFQFVKYSPESVPSLFKFLEAVPQYTQPNFQEQYYGQSILSQIRINLNNFQMKSSNIQINGDFPVCEDSLVGKQWKQTYAVGSINSNQFLQFNTLLKYNRNQKLLIQKPFPQNTYLNEPALIRTIQSLYILIVTNKQNKSFINLLDASTLQQICELQLPYFIPAGFHGKWENQ